MPQEQKSEKEEPQSSTRRRKKVDPIFTANHSKAKKAEYTMNTPNRVEQQSKKKWIGLVNVRPKAGNDTLGNALGAFVASIALAEGPRDFGQKVTEVLDHYGFDVVQIEDVEPFEDRLQKHAITPNILKLAEDVTRENPVALADFHSYKQ